MCVCGGGGWGDKGGGIKWRGGRGDKAMAQSEQNQFLSFLIHNRPTVVDHRIFGNN